MLRNSNLLFQDAEAGEDSSAGLRGGAAEGAEHAAGEGGRQSQRGAQTIKRHSKVRSESVECLTYDIPAAEGTSRAASVSWEETAVPSAARRTTLVI